MSRTAERGNIKLQPFYRWLDANYCVFFPNLPGFSRLRCLLRDNVVYTNRFLAEPSFFTIPDTYGIETDSSMARRAPAQHPLHLATKGW